MHITALIVALASLISQPLQGNWQSGQEDSAECHTTVGLSYTTDKGILYSDKDKYARKRCRLDIYHPVQKGKYPVVVWFHGGGLTQGERFVPQELEEQGLVVVAAGYRLMPKCRIEDCIDDAAAAVSWTIRNIEAYGGDPDKIFVAGHSAGGYLTEMIGLDKSWLGAYGVDANSLAGLFPFSGQAITHFALREREGMSPLQPLIDRFAPLYHVRPDAPPIILITGDRENELYGRYEENAYLWRMLKLTGHNEVYLYELPGYDHGGMASPAHAIMLDHIRRITQE